MRKISSEKNYFLPFSSRRRVRVADVKVDYAKYSSRNAHGKNCLANMHLPFAGLETFFFLGEMLNKQKEKTELKKGE
jgi:hypothetical protein